jgi:hypothetical protein
MSSATLITPLAYNPEVYGQPPNNQTGSYPTPTSNAAKLQGWTDPSLSYLPPGQSMRYAERPPGTGPNVWTNPYP